MKRSSWLKQQQNSPSHLHGEIIKDLQLKFQERLSVLTEMTQFQNPFEADVRCCSDELHCLHLATGRTRDEIEKRIWQRREKEKGRNGREEGAAKKKAGVVKSRHGWTMYGNPVTSEYILDFKKCPIEGME
ncbi:hypothetical protein TNCV_1241561 [Trichonephila clavipes]|nr:hypothetical protein TNCV_1241561 [Trichonephila clavipes]